MVATGFIIPLTSIQIFLTFFLFFSLFDRSYYIKIYKYFAVICIGVFVLQEISFHISGIRVSGIIPWLPLHDFNDAGWHISELMYANRSSSIFLEPAHLAHFLMPLLAIELYFDNHKYHYYYVAVIVGVLLLLRSGNAIVGMVPIFLLTLPVFSKGSKSKTWGTFLILALVLVVVGYYYIGSEMGAALMERQTELNSTYSGGSRSGFLRVWRGIYVYEDYSLWEKLFGCPDSTAQFNHVVSSGMSMGLSAELYFNAFQKILLNTGIIGVGLFVYIFVKMWRGNSICGRAILLSLIVTSFIAAIYMSHTMIVFMLLAESMKEKYNAPIKTIMKR